MSPLLTIKLDRLIPSGMTALAAASPQLLRTVLIDVATVAAHQWRKAAVDQLRSSAREYAEGVQDPVFIGSDRAQVSLVGLVPNMVEQGWEGGDMRDWLCSPTAPNARPVKGPHGEIIGYYNTIPYRHSKSGSGYAVGTPIGSEYKDMDPTERSTLGTKIWAAMKQLAPTHGGPGEKVGIGPRQMTKTEWGERLPAGMAPIALPHHKTDPFAGTVRNEKTYAHATQSSMVSFRRISSAPSEDGDAKAWQNPGIKARHLLDGVQALTEKAAAKMIESMLRSVVSSGEDKR